MMACTTDQEQRHSTRRGWSRSDHAPAGPDATSRSRMWIVAGRSRGAAVRAEQPAQPLVATDTLDGFGLGLAIDQQVSDALVVPLEVVVRRVFLDGVPQVPLADRHDPRQALLLDRPHESLRVGVEVGAMGREHDGLDTRRAQRGGEGAEQLGTARASGFQDGRSTHHMRVIRAKERISRPSYRASRPRPWPCPVRSGLSILYFREWQAPGSQGPGVVVDGAIGGAVDCGMVAVGQAHRDRRVCPRPSARRAGTEIDAEPSISVARGQSRCHRPDLASIMNGLISSYNTKYGLAPGSPGFQTPANVPGFETGTVKFFDIPALGMKLFDAQDYVAPGP
jgi:hypothetical protein